jgi:hypothetical protein
MRVRNGSAAIETISFAIAAHRFLRAHEPALLEPFEQGIDRASAAAPCRRRRVEQHATDRVRSARPALPQETQHATLELARGDHGAIVQVRSSATNGARNSTIDFGVRLAAP